MKNRVYERIHDVHKPKKGSCRDHQSFSRVYNSTLFLYSVDPNEDIMSSINYYLLHREDAITTSDTNLQLSLLCSNVL